MVKASFYCACITTVLLFAIVFALDSNPLKIDFDLILGVAIAGGYMWVQNFTLCIMLLLPHGIV